MSGYIGNENGFFMARNPSEQKIIRTTRGRGGGGKRRVCGGKISYNRFSCWQCIQGDGNFNVKASGIGFGGVQYELN
ncbi:MAG: hypothetical protein CO170_03300 [candidate division SR1 bacterium CG_4_9_14_3_um_filter_40_9]|nr:MAG: hypothetical protein CO170_03300 [candidate division SR1 bacterium CG_4_9_14_3_um_filter_40_9]